MKVISDEQTLVSHASILLSAATTGDETGNGTSPYNIRALYKRHGLASFSLQAVDLLQKGVDALSRGDTSALEDITTRLNACCPQMVHGLYAAAVTSLVRSHTPYEEAMKRLNSTEGGYNHFMAQHDQYVERAAAYMVVAAGLQLLHKAPEKLEELIH
ncbi:hypothetical protein COY95_04000 [Candidatus Woesearchaeota archaeon CG_4_10_14_0_8_um_filter_47_5]|nr:MAG: hypothetical protein COY95_04000 [Candidatus Woesearchaeota archaeon CG_4_10_14_0_8_um_filter_47_5]